MHKRAILPILAALAILPIALTGCISAAGSSRPERTDTNSGTEADADPQPSPSFAETPDVPEPVGNLAFGDAITYEDEVSMSVSAPTPFTPGEYAAGATQPNNVVFTLTITNGSTENLQPSVYTRVSSGGSEGSSIFDTGNPVGEIGGSPSTVILPGQTVTWLEAYSIADPADLVVQTNPSFDYEDAIFTNVAS